MAGSCSASSVASGVVGVVKLSKGGVPGKPALQRKSNLSGLSDQIGPHIGKGNAVARKKHRGNPPHLSKVNFVQLSQLGLKGQIGYFQTVELLC